MFSENSHLAELAYVEALDCRVMENKVEQAGIWGSLNTTLRCSDFYSWIKRPRCIYVCMYVNVVSENLCLI